jgi:hypothetical protein
MADCPEVKRLVHVPVFQESIATIDPDAKFLLGHHKGTGEVRIYYDPNNADIKEVTGDACGAGGNIVGVNQLTLLEMAPTEGADFDPCCWYVFCCGQVICIHCP